MNEAYLDVNGDVTIEGGIMASEFDGIGTRDNGMVGP